MKTRSAFLGALLVSAAVSLSARADFLLVQKIEGPGNLSEITTRIKGDRCRTDVSPAMSMLIDAKTGDLITLMHAQKSYTVMNAQAARAMMEQFQKPPPGQPPPSPPPALKPTGNTQTINGFATQEYVATIEGTTIHYWCSKDPPNWAALCADLKRFEQAATRGGPGEPPDLPGVPVRTVTNAAGQTITTTLVSVKEENLNPADFEIPAGYRKLEMPAPNAPGPK